MADSEKRIEIDPNDIRTKVSRGDVSTSGKKLKPVVKSDAIVQTKPSAIDRIKSTFFGNTDGLGSYVFKDFVVPAIENTVLDVLEAIFNNDTDRSSRRPRIGVGRRNDDPYPYHTSYRSSGSSRDRRRDRDDSYRRDDGKIDYRNVVVKYRSDAEEIVDQLLRRIETYGQATIADLYDLIDVASSYTDSNWGWSDRRDIGLKRVSSGYLIDVAEARYLD